MAKWANDGLMDAGLTWLGTASTKVSICLSQPADLAALGTSALGTVATTSGNFTNGNGDGSGRKVTHSAATLTVGTSGTVSHIALSGGSLNFVGTCAPTAVTASGTVILSAWDVTEIADPA
jgi:hypothetical protein